MRYMFHPVSACYLFINNNTSPFVCSSRLTASLPISDCECTSATYCNSFSHLTQKPFQRRPSIARLLPSRERYIEQKSREQALQKEKMLLSFRPATVAAGPHFTVIFIFVVVALFVAATNGVWTCPSGRDPFCCAKYDEVGKDKTEQAVIGSDCMCSLDTNYMQLALFYFGYYDSVGCVCGGAICVIHTRTASDAN